MAYEGKLWATAVAVASAAYFGQMAIGRASGFLVYDLGADANGQASAVSASTSEPEAVWYNPAGLSLMSGYAASIGALVLVANSEFTPADGRPPVAVKRDAMCYPPFSPLVN